MTHPLFAIGQPVTYSAEPYRTFRIIHRDLKLQGWHYAISRDQQDWSLAKIVPEWLLMGAKINKSELRIVR